MGTMCMHAVQLHAIGLQSVHELCSIGVMDHAILYRYDARRPHLDQFPYN